MTSRALIPVGIFLLAACAFAPALRNDYVLDDIAQVRFLRLHEPTVSSWLSAARHPWWARESWTAWRPVTRLAILAEKHAATRWWETAESWPYRVASVALHGLGSVLAFALARFLGVGTAGAAVAGAVLAVHPLRSEGVHQIVGQAEVLAALFMTGGALLYAVARSRGHGAVRIALVQGAAYALALGSKEHAALYPAYLLLVEAALPARPGTPRSRRILPPVLVALASVLALFLWGKAVVAGAILQAPGTVSRFENPFAGLPLSERIPGALGVLGYVATRVIYPFGLSPDYSAEALPVHLGWGWPLAWLGFVVIVGGVAWIGLDLSRRGSSWTTVAAAFLAWGFVSNVAFVHGTGFALRLLYFPMVPVALGIGAAAARSPARGRFAGAAVASYLALCVAGSWSFAPAWRTEITFAEATLRAFPRSWRAHHNLAALRSREGDFVAGHRHALEAAAIRPDDASTWNSVAGSALGLEGQEAVAEAAARRSIALRPRFPPPWEHLGRALERQGRAGEALEAFEEYVRLVPSRKRRLEPTLLRLRGERPPSGP